MNNYDEVIEIDSPYGHITISYNLLGSQRIKVLDIDGGMESATYIEKDLQNELLFAYLDLFKLMFDENYLQNRMIKEILLIGGGGFQFPKYFLSHYSGNIDVVEINSVLYEISKKHFFLEETIQRYDPQQTRLHCYFEDGRNYLDRNLKKYDVILSDVFLGENLVLSLHSIEAIKRIKESLNPNGMYMTNVIGSLVGKYSQNLKDIVLTLKQCFQYVYVFKAMENTEHEQNQNFVVIGMDEKVHFNIVSYRNINQKIYHQGMINHVDDIEYTNGHILRDKNLL